MPTTDSITGSEQRVLDALRAFITERGLAPTGRELAERVQVSPTRVAQVLDRLEGRGLIRREPTIARGIFLTEKDAA
jgi:DNA-binding MarR family transcriptional regulator